MASLGFIGPPPKILGPPQILFFAQVPPNYFGLKFLGPPPKIRRGGAATMLALHIFETFVSILLIVNLSLNQTLLAFLLCVRQTWMTQLVLAVFL